jgi:hypothetical protein
VTLIRGLVQIDDGTASNRGIGGSRNLAVTRFGVGSGEDGTARKRGEERSLSRLDDVQLKIHRAGRVPPPREEIYGDGSGGEVCILPNGDARVGGGRGV